MPLYSAPAGSSATSAVILTIEARPPDLPAGGSSRPSASGGEVFLHISNVTRIPHDIEFRNIAVSPSPSQCAEVVELPAMKQNPIIPIPARPNKYTATP